MLGQLVRRSFSSRSAIRAPPAPSSTTMSFANNAPRTAVREGRVAMLPKASEPRPLPSTVSHASTTSAAATGPSTEEIFEVGSVSVPGDEPKVLRVAGK
ncbi:hypothetical protein BCV70DRAFT_199455 [Testicularia cyperi]|uniref:Uncharacterized protein n=1 Tax=Testicularia cyperi TaxID=1882483 RepID=A0A317XSK9_9BASI|nr:hypothetical protein BCV70DRAFT_199455 [Testicularia cyperi]